MKKTNKNNKVVKATISQIIVAFLYVGILIGVVYILFGEGISKAFSIVDMISIETRKETLKEVKIDLETKNLKAYPEVGTRYGTVKIPSLEIELPLYFGDSLDILKNGIGHTCLSYFPGEGGSILCMGHNTDKFLKKLPQIKMGDKIIIETSYGIYTYESYNTRIVDQYELEAAPLNREKEVLMLYTCYPVDGLGHATQRFFVYANLVNEELIND